MSFPFRLLRRARIVFAVALFVLLSAQFLNMYHALPKAYYMGHPVFTQFGPSLLRMLAEFSVVSGAAFVTFCLCALLFGRVYCSFFCAFGILMDIVRKAAKFPAENRLLKKTALGKYCAAKFATMGYARPRNRLRAFFTLLAALAVAFGLTSLLGLVEPYSLYGKVMGSVANTLAAFGLGALSERLADFGVYSVPPINGGAEISFAAFGFALAVLACITAASALRGRIYCNTVCPVGGLLGLLSSVSLFRLRLDPASCVGCGKCARACKAECIDAKSRSLDFSRCVLCFDCAASCPKSSIGFELSPFWRRAFGGGTAGGAPAEKRGRAGFSRRDFVKGAPFAASVFCMAAKKDIETAVALKDPEVLAGASPYRLSGRRPDKRLPSPPGSVSIENFLSHCTGCQICVAACQSRILKPSVGEWGLSGFMQPYMDFDAGFCLHACHDCSKVCPTGAIRFISGSAKKLEKIGTAIFREDLCIVNTNGTDCSACGEHCPVSAIEMLPFKPEKSLYIPHVHKDVCIGCGACEYICPVIPQKAIVVQGLSVHKKAKPFEQSMRLYVPQKPQEASGAAPQPGPPPENPFPF